MVPLTEPVLGPVLELGGDRPALRVGDRGLSYGELREAAAAVAGRLAGVQRAAVWAEPTLETCVTVVAAVCAGIPLVPINPKLGAAELRHVIADSAPELILGAPDGALDGVEAAPPVQHVDLDERGGELGGEALDPERPALVIYTSGTTGAPKGAVLSRRAVASNLDGLADAWDWTGEDVLAHGLPLFHVHGLVLGLLGPLRLGGELRHLVRFEPRAASEALRDGATLLFGVPTMYHRLGREAEADEAIVAGLKHARLLVSGSAPLPAPEFERMRELCGQEIVERYGLTETLMNTAVRADGERRPGYVGPPVPGVELRLVADDGTDVEASDGETIGEVAVRGPNLFTEYLKRPEATAEAVRDGWFHTGDIATRAPDGYWRIVGRRSTDLIKTGGYKVGAGEVEVALLDHPGVAEAAVTGEQDPDLGEKIVAWVVADERAERPEERALADHVASQLAPHKRPRDIRFLDELPRNAMGKVVKQRLSE